MLNVDIATYYVLQGVIEEGWEITKTRDFDKVLWKVIRNLEKPLKMFLFGMCLEELRYYKKGAERGLVIEIMPTGERYPTYEEVSFDELEKEYIPHFHWEKTVEGLVEAFGAFKWYYDYGGKAWKRVAEASVMPVRTVIDFEKLLYVAHNNGRVYLAEGFSWWQKEMYRTEPDLWEILNIGRDWIEMPFMDIKVKKWLELVGRVHGLPPGRLNPPTRLPKWGGSWWLEVYRE